MRDLSTPSTPKRVRVAPNLWQRTKDGRFEDIRVNPATGKQQLRTLKAKTLTEAKREQRALAVSVDGGEAVAPSRLRFGEVAQEFIDNFESLVASGERSARTLERYREHLDHHLLPYFGRREIQKITPDVVARFFIEKRDAVERSERSSAVRNAAAAGSSPHPSPPTSEPLPQRCPCRSPAEGSRHPRPY